jgi:hypothetical protein
MIIIIMIIMITITIIMAVQQHCHLAVVSKKGKNKAMIFNTSHTYCLADKHWLVLPASTTPPVSEIFTEIPLRSG